MYTYLDYTITFFSVLFRFLASLAALVNYLKNKIMNDTICALKSLIYGIVMTDYKYAYTHYTKRPEKAKV